MSKLDGLMRILAKRDSTGSHIVTFAWEEDGERVIDELNDSGWIVYDYVEAKEFPEDLDSFREFVKLCLTTGK